ncbi:MAG TPA: hypothetical protein H9950_03970 [Candidatus Bacteroides avicola]|uniref:Uncharacterized protein n=1 Tax=Candidatus Bacteroides avicola TaxID=2838468 RepID=A0A9D2HWD4_9BACE|nr:hypothetical protein [Candidatus Bacteroides avicola]
MIDLLKNTSPIQLHVSIQKSIKLRFIRVNLNLSNVNLNLNNVTWHFVKPCATTPKEGTASYKEELRKISFTPSPATNALISGKLL